MKTLNILSRHTSLLAAVKAAGLDLSYNEPLALADIAHLDGGGFSRGIHGRTEIKPVTEVFVTDDGIYYTFECDLRLLNKYEPFHACMHDGAFAIAVLMPAQVEGLKDIIHVTDPIFKDRSYCARLQKTEAFKGAWFVK